MLSVQYINKLQNTLFLSLVADSN